MRVILEVGMLLKGRIGAPKDVVWEITQVLSGGVKAKTVVPGGLWAMGDIVNFPSTYSDEEQAKGWNPPYDRDDLIADHWELIPATNSLSYIDGAW